MDATTTTRDRILQAAWQVLNVEGFGALTQTRVAERAGIRQSNLTYHFPSRVALLSATAEFSCAAMQPDFDALIASGKFTLARFRDFVIDEVPNRSMARLMCGLIAAADEEPEIRRWLIDFENTNRASIRDMFAALGYKVSAKDIEILHAAFVGCSVLNLGESSDESRERFKRVMRAEFDRVVANSPRSSPQTRSKNPKK